MSNAYEQIVKEMKKMSANHEYKQQREVASDYKRIMDNINEKQKEPKDTKKWIGAM